jgi:hypothetical protein
MVEAPGTAPGSALPISQHVYRHSWSPSTPNIRVLGLVSKNSFSFDVVSIISLDKKVSFFGLILNIRADYQLAQGYIKMPF